MADNRIIRIDADTSGFVSSLQRIPEQIKATFASLGTGQVDQIFAGLFENALQSGKDVTEQVKLLKKELEELQSSGLEGFHERLQKIHQEKEKIGQDPFGQDPSGQRTGKLNREEHALTTEMQQESKINSQLIERLSKLIETLKSHESTINKSQEPEAREGVLERLRNEFIELSSKREGAETKESAIQYTKRMQETANRMRQITSPDDEGGGGGSGLGGRIGGAIGQTFLSGGITSSVLMQLGVGGLAAAAAFKIGQAAFSAEGGAAKLRAVTKGGQGGEDFGAGMDENYTGFGLGSNEYKNIMTQMALKRGKGGSDLEKQAYRSTSFERTFGLEIGSTLSQNSNLRYETSGATDIVRINQEMLKTFQDMKVYGINKDDFTKIQEKLEIMNQLGSMQVSQTGELNSKISMNLLGAIGKMKGAYGDVMAGDTLGRLNQGITNPANDFIKAKIFTNISKSNKNMTPFGALERMGEGIFGEGNLSGLLEPLMEGSRDYMASNVMGMFGMGANQAGKFTDTYRNDKDFRKLLNSATNDKEIKGVMEGKFGDDWLKEMGTKGTATSDQVATKFSNAVDKFSQTVELLGKDTKTGEFSFSKLLERLIQPPSSMGIPQELKHQ